MAVDLYLLADKHNSPECQLELSELIKKLINEKNLRVIFPEGIESSREIIQDSNLLGLAINEGKIIEAQLADGRKWYFHKDESLDKSNYGNHISCIEYLLNRYNKEQLELIAVENEGLLKIAYFAKIYLEVPSYNGNKNIADMIAQTSSLPNPESFEELRNDIKEHLNNLYGAGIAINNLGANLIKLLTPFRNAELIGNIKKIIAARNIPIAAAIFGEAHYDGAFMQLCRPEINPILYNI